MAKTVRNAALLVVDVVYHVADIPPLELLHVYGLVFVVVTNHLPVNVVGVRVVLGLASVGGQVRKDRKAVPVSLLEAELGHFLGRAKRAERSEPSEAKRSEASEASGI